ncbi:hypothetical protein CHL78_016830 [Romboutsia weinsteinii]|uniref:Uncharacterized protein n=1 Tax=Romboutsia weinsteinii TaxID=2020949 RepID=A0A371IYZ0_9FIRM|nr:hypothetical protein [Romboutsia weinsteinii]RDY25705.1 hypothetical protein CHL78_016830 [Romboutsia weinsteinii]
MIQTSFENRKLKIEYIEEVEEGIKSSKYKFRVDIKDFDTPCLGIEYDEDEDVIERIWIEEDGFDNDAKGHVVYKIFSLIEYEVIEIMKFMIKHI